MGGAAATMTSSRRSAKAYDLGVTPFDTTELYGMGNGWSEKLLGQWVNVFRSDVGGRRDRRIEAVARREPSADRVVVVDETDDRG